ncbi:tRNA pseudouridine(38-40) synthase TruA [Undibacterium arcticum]|uniref:tRNA pseudouridine synthase A n=1 Tax=Undibacterium arcticum TaxID=1762892 RepID=A0ABV7F3U0_9BURK
MDKHLKRIALGIQYDGAPWHGWQTQPGGQTVQDRLQTALRQFACTDIATTCAGRTDTGVHALEQVVHFDTKLQRDTFSWVRGVNAFLPPSIAVRWACDVPRDPHDPENPLTQFHARFSATARTYHYLLYNHPIRSPLLAGKAGWAFRPLQLEPMREAARHLVGNHDFTAFRAAECQAKSPVKTMHAIRIEQRGDLFVFTLHANAFLHHMVRNIVGSLIYVGNGNQPPQWLAEILHSGNRKLAAPTFMPDGLYLANIDYDAKWGLPQQTPNLMPWL